MELHQLVEGSTGPGYLLRFRRIKNVNWLKQPKPAIFKNMSSINFVKCTSVFELAAKTRHRQRYIDPTNHSANIRRSFMKIMAFQYQRHSMTKTQNLKLL